MRMCGETIYIANLDCHDLNMSALAPPIMQRICIYSGEECRAPEFVKRARVVLEWSDSFSWNDTQIRTNFFSSDPLPIFRLP